MSSAASSATASQPSQTAPIGFSQTQNIPGFNYNEVRGFTGTFDQALDAGSIRDITEETWSLFLRVNFEADIAGMPFFFSAGVRNENTHITANGNGTVPIQILPSTADPTLLTVVCSLA